ncbi:MAG TPA: site-specific integrase [Planctomycetota bacterium]|nr:site-specific integrase [Planctomycetota bacterium]
MSSRSSRARSRVHSPNFRPRYRRHRSGQARVTIDGKDIYLGRFGTAESHEAYDRVLREWLDQGRRPGANLRLVAVEEPGDVEPDGILVAELLAAYWQMLKDDGFVREQDIKKDSHIGNFQQAIKPLKDSFPATPAAKFGPRALRKVRALMIDKGLSSGTINARVNMIRRVFKWGASMELFPVEVYQALATLEPIQAGQFPELDSQPIQPVAAPDVFAILPHLSSQVATMVQLQWITGMRPGEVCAMRWAEIDRNGPKQDGVQLWIYRPTHHKTEHHGRERVIPLGPKCQELLKPFLKVSPGAFVFTPEEAERERRCKQRTQRKTPLWSSHVRAQVEAKAGREARDFTDRYDVHAYRRAIERACKKAGVDVWSPNRLRHSAATRIRHSHGIEAARVLLGHSSPATTEIYAQMDQQHAVRIMATEG